MSDDALVDLDKLIVTVITVAAALLWLASLACGAWIFFNQVGGFLSEGTWNSISLIDAIEWLEWESLSEWARHPGSWLGVHKIFDFLPASLGVPLIGGIFPAAARLAGFLYDDSHR